jgi:hypothetical protein
MMMPSWIQEACLDDSAFSLAYDLVSAPHRALIKTALARQDALHPAVTCRTWRRWRELDADVALIESKQPVDAALVIFDQQTSCAGLAAALMPVLNAGVPEVLALYAGEQDQEVPAALLTTLELAGQERVAVLPPERIRRFTAELCRSSDSCAILILGETTSCLDASCEAASGCRIWRASPVKRAAVYLSGHGRDVNLEALAFAWPATDFGVAGVVEAALPSHRFRLVGKELGDLPAGREMICFAPDCNVEALLPRYAGVFGPGHEACMVWPDLNFERFFVRRTAWRSITPSETEES